MEKQEAQNLPHGQIVTDGTLPYTVHRYENNPHDLWFWQTSKRTRHINKRHGGKCKCKRVYLGSKNIKPSGIDFLETLHIC